MGFRFVLGIKAAEAGIPVRALAGWALTLLGLVLFAVVVRTWLTGQRLGGRHRVAGGHADTGCLGQDQPVTVTEPARGRGQAGLAGLTGTAESAEPVVVLLGGEENGHYPASASAADGLDAGVLDLDALDAGVLDLDAPDADAPDADAPDADAPDADAPDADAPDADAGGPGSSAISERFYPAALRLLGVQRRASRSADCAGSLVQRIEVAMGDYRIEVLLAEAPAGDRTGRSEKIHTWIAPAPYLVWTPLPYDVPADGVAFACVGAGDEGCLFLDLSAAPGAITIGGDQAAATRFAESLAHQLCRGPAADHIGVVVVGSALPPPPLGAEWLPSVADLVQRQPRQDGQVEMVFCRLNSAKDVFPLARYVSSAPYRVIPIVLADLPDAPWSFTASPSALPAKVLQPAVP